MKERVIQFKMDNSALKVLDDYLESLLIDITRSEFIRMAISEKLERSRQIGV